jgi:hypothetical protein
LIDTELLPPNPFVTAPVQLAMVRSAQRDRKFVTDLPRQRAALCVLEMVRIRRAAGTEEAGLGSDELQVITVPHSQRLPDRGYFFDCSVGWDAIGCSIFAPCGGRRPAMAV